MCWVLFGVCAWILLLISSFHREAVEGVKDCDWENWASISSSASGWCCGPWTRHFSSQFNVLV